jgi:nucleotide-binding universal stress UspA family protein
VLEFKKVLFPIDFSERCHGAAHYVEALATHFGSEVILLHVLETTMGRSGDLDFGGLTTSLHWEERTGRAQEALDRFLEDELSHIKVDRRLEAGDPARTIVKVAHEEHVDLIMMPTHGYGAFRRFVFGSVTAKVLHDARCAVWTGVHMEDAPPLDAIVVRNVVCAPDLTEDSMSAFVAAIEIAREYGAKLTVTHEAKAGVKACVCDKAHKAELLVIGRDHHSGFARLRTHSYSMIRESPCPVISI